MYSVYVSVLILCLAFTLLFGTTTIDSNQEQVLVVAILWTDIISIGSIYCFHACTVCAVW